jgi:hypothetical protein
MKLYEKDCAHVFSRLPTFNCPGFQPANSFFSCSYKLFCRPEKCNSRIFSGFHTLPAKSPGWASSISSCLSTGGCVSLLSVTSTPSATPICSISCVHFPSSTGTAYHPHPLPFFARISIQRAYSPGSAKNIILKQLSYKVSKGGIYPRADIDHCLRSARSRQPSNHGTRIAEHSLFSSLCPPRTLC